MSTCFWYKECKVCEQGRLFIVEDLSRHRLYLHCEECEIGFIEPCHMKSGETFLTLDLDYDCRYADQETIDRYDWQKFALNSSAIADAPKLC